MTPHRPRVLAHRGASGYAAENSIEAFKEARSRGSDGVELDIHATHDGELVVHHDADIPRLGAIGHLGFAAVRTARLPNGEAIPTLREALMVLGGLEVWVEVKELPEEWDAALLARLAASPTPGRCAVHSFDHRIIARLGGKAPALRRGILSKVRLPDPGAALAANGATALWQEVDGIDAELVGAVHRRGGEVIAWTVNDAAVARRLASLGVDALCGNYPDRLILS